MAIMMLGSLPGFLAAQLPAGSQTGPPPGKSDAPSQKVIASEMEIKKLVAGLGDRDFIVREKSTAHLKEIGLPALRYLEDALDSADPETRLRAEALVTEIRTANRRPTRVNGLEFKLVVSKTQWAIPEPGKTTTFEIKLEVTNVGKMVSKLYLPIRDSGVVLKDSEKTDLVRFLGQERSPKLTPLSVLSPKESASFSLTGSLGWEKGKLVFACSDPLSRGWAGRGLSKGRYYLSLIYESNSKTGRNGEPLWVGRAETVPETIIIR
jgi:hypothetical protein